MLRKELLREYYYSRKLSMFDVAKVFAVTPATVIYWMKKYNLGRRSSSESAYVKQNPDGDPFKIKDKLTDKDRELLLSGLMLYWAAMLGIPRQFISVNIHPDKRSKVSEQWSKYGIARIEVRNVKLKQWIDNSLKGYLTQWI